MIELYYWPTPNGHKVTMLLEEVGAPYTIKSVNIGKGEQFEPDFLKIAPNNRMPAIIDTQPLGGGAPLSLFESGAILEYIADKTGQFLPKEARARYDVLQWLYWQMGGLGPMLGQNHHFSQYAPEKLPYAIERYQKETARLYGVLNTQLSEREFLAEEYSIADMACYPWIVPHTRQGVVLSEFPHLKRWFTAIRHRPATQRAYAAETAFEKDKFDPAAVRDVLFGQGRRDQPAPLKNTEKE